MKIVVFRNALPGLTTFQVGSRSRPNVMWFVQYVRRARRQSWFCQCEHFITAKLPKRRHCDHIKALRARAKEAGGVRRLAHALLEEQKLEKAA